MGKYLGRDQGFLDMDDEKLSFLKTVTCSDIMPQSSKVVVVDVNIPLSCAFDALIENSIFFFKIFCDKCASSYQKKQKQKR